MMILCTAYEMYYEDTDKTKEERITIARAILKQVNYEDGYIEEITITHVNIWCQDLCHYIKCGVDGNMKKGETIIKAKYKGLCHKDQGRNSRYLQYFWYTQKTDGRHASFDQVALLFNLKSTTPNKIQLIIKLHKLQLFW